MNQLLFAFDLDGTLLNSQKEISDRTVRAIREMHDDGHIIVLASGRLGSSLMKYEDVLGVPFSTVTLNGAAAYRGGAGHSEPIFNKPLSKKYSNELLSFYKESSRLNAGNKKFSINFYHSDKLYTENENRNGKWVDIYIHETASEYNYVSDIFELNNKEPEKILFCGDPKTLDDIEKLYRNRWDSSVYIVRTWDKYLEFLNRDVNKAVALEKVAKSYGLTMGNVVSFGDGDNDAPMLNSSKLGIAVRNGTVKAKASAHIISQFSNDEDVIAKEWERIIREGVETIT